MPFLLLSEEKEWWEKFNTEDALNSFVKDELADHEELRFYKLYVDESLMRKFALEFVPSIKEVKESSPSTHVIEYEV